MTILHISDTHGLHAQMPPLPLADVVVHSGDITMHGSAQEVFAFYEWFSALPHRYKIYIAGNHDECLYQLLPEHENGCDFLQHSSVIIEGRKFYGVPFFMQDILTGDERMHIESIPCDVDVLITHQPPFGILDFDGTTHYGNPLLLEKINCIKPRLHLFGHVHSCNGVWQSCNGDYVSGNKADATGNKADNNNNIYGNGSNEVGNRSIIVKKYYITSSQNRHTIFSNAALVNSDYQPQKLNAASHFFNYI